MSRIFIIIILVLSACPVLQAQETYSRAKLIVGPNGLTRLADYGVAADHGIRTTENSFVSDFSSSELEIIADLGIKYEVIIKDVQAYLKAQYAEKSFGESSSSCEGSVDANLVVPENFEMDETYAGFYRYENMLAALDEMKAQFPDLITEKTQISDILTHEERPVYHVIISDNPETDEADEPKVLYTAIHHAREPLSMSQTIFYMWYLLENYETNDEVKFLVDNTQMFFVPCINPDGYLFNEENNSGGFGFHRKNMAPVGTSNPGVDLNRNYGYEWGTTGISFNQNSDVYPGSGPFSEPETQAMRWLMYNNNFRFAANAHSFGNLLLHPVGTTFEEFADHHNYFTAYTNHMASCNGYIAQKSSGLSLASGDSDDYSYQVDIGVESKDTIFSMTPEVGTSFWPEFESIIPSCNDMLLPNLVMSHLTHNYYVITEEDASTVIASLDQEISLNVQRLGLEEGSVSVSIIPISTNIESVGNALSFDLNLMESSTGVIDFQLSSDIANGDIVEYVIATDFGNWVREEQISRTFATPAELQFVDDATETDNWEGDWNNSPEEFVSPNQSFTDSPISNYSNNSFSSYELIDEINLENTEQVSVSFYARWEIETGFDQVQFQVSTDGGNSWTPQCGIYTTPGVDDGVQTLNEPLYDGVQSEWVQERISLEEYVGEVIKVRFILESDNFVNGDGFYFDDFELAYNMTEVSVLELVNSLNGGMVKILDNLGRAVLENEISRNLFSIDVSSLVPGAYFLEITNPEGVALPSTQLLIE